MRRIGILGVEVDNCDEPDAARRIESFLDAAEGGVRHVVTVNPEFIMEARRNPAFRDVLKGADLATPDGVGIVLAARLLGTPVRGRATGVSLVKRLAEMSPRTGCRLFLLGAAPGVAAEAGAQLARLYPGVHVVGTYAGSPDPLDFPEIRRRLDDARPHVLLVAYGAPRQDLWIGEHRDCFPDSVRVAMGVGGVFDYLSGRVPLAPPVMRRAGLEWLYRLYKQPWRWRRILKVFQFGAIVLRVAVRKRLRRVIRISSSNSNKG